ncbi:fructose 1,6-bisphosphatase [Microbacterium sp. NE2HP2]|uniref:Fructose 1,6-bisphosphatase n=1 Tax=Microbacterium plantarum TaxID=1816425 RepID=A0ABV5EMP4_9MICO|nr:MULTISPECIES: fructose 1,6-bisphosphatase [Microbacterium]MDD7945523.1 fructose 1,6-bisphosphatase [Microbacterium plantarum]RAZ30693.1 fructose 1,6-bisphosphatase [Microbacterium sp. SMR1]
MSPRRTPASRTRALRTAVSAGAIALSLVALSGCSQLTGMINSVQGEPVSAVPAPAPSQSPAMAFNSQFTYDGSVSLSSDVAQDLELRLDVWAQDPKRTQEWTPGAEKTFGFAVNVHDNRVDEKSVLSQKRRVFISSISITSQTAQTSGQVQSPFQFSADPRTLVPSDTIRSDRGLLLNSFQGGLYVPETVIHGLPADTYGMTLEFAMTVWVEGNANDDASFTQQTVYQYLPVAIFSDEQAADAAPAPAPTATP